MALLPIPVYVSVGKENFPCHLNANVREGSGWDSPVFSLIVPHVLCSAKKATRDKLVDHSEEAGTGLEARFLVPWKNTGAPSGF